MQGADGLMGEYPDLDSSDQEIPFDEDQVDSDGEPIMSPQEVADIINSIPSYQFEEDASGYESSVSKMSSAKSK